MHSDRKLQGGHSLLFARGHRQIVRFDRMSRLRLQVYVITGRAITKKVRGIFDEF